jgi:ATP-dependent Lhr-like helicase
LSRADFDAALAYLSGRHTDGRSWLPSRLRWEGDRFAIADQRTLKLLRRNLGTILTEEARAVRQIISDAASNDADTTTSIAVGSVDDAYADRLRPGDRLLLDGRCFEYRRRDYRDLLVDEVSTRPVVPRWIGSGVPLSRALAQLMFLFRLQAADILREGSGRLLDWLGQDYGLGPAAAAELARFFLLQEAVSEIPDASTLLVEVVTDYTATYHVHTPLHRAGNDVLARLASWRLFRERGLACQTVVADLGFSLALMGNASLDPAAWRRLLSTTDFDRDVDAALRDSASLRERFANVATTGLMVLRQPLGGRRKVGGRDWAQRRLFDQVRDADPEFVLLRQAERELRTDVVDAEAARCYVAGLPNRHVHCRRLAQVSAFAAGWTQPGQVIEEPMPDANEVRARLHAELAAAAR